MCEFCTKHGEGKKWYENMHNYSEELYHLDHREEYVRDFLERFEAGHIPRFKTWHTVGFRLPVVHRFLRALVDRAVKRFHYGQVVPIEDAEAILDRVSSISRLPCVCRSNTLGRKELRYCLAIGVDVSGTLGQYPDYASGLEVIDAETAKEMVRRLDREGAVHTIWTFKTPFIGAMCNCDRDCLAYRLQVTNDDIKVYFKAEYVAQVDPEQCVGCRKCIEYCQFGAITFSLTQRRAHIDALTCYGCGVCRANCPAGAISLVPRETLPGLADVW